MAIPLLKSDFSKNVIYLILILTLSIKNVKF